jgi:Zn-dependent peptidase ImmA (M78 family)
MPVRRKHIRSLVEQLLAAQGVRSAAVDVELIATALGVQIHNEVAADNLSGFLIRDVESKRAMIGVNSTHSAARKRFTIAHEIAHFLLHEGDVLHVDQREGVDLGLRMKRRDPGSSLGIDDEEKEANLFAAELLMPTSFLETDLLEMKASAPQDEDEDIVEALAKRYDVSIQAMTFRLTNLGLLHL